MARPPEPPGLGLVQPIYRRRAAPRHSVVGLTVPDEGLDVRFRFHAGWRFYAASVIKVTRTVLTPRSRSCILLLMAHVVAWQRWGVPAGAPGRVTAHVKDGWLSYPTSSDWNISSIGALTGSHLGWQTAVLTTANRDMTYGIDTIQPAARVINRDLANF